MRMDPREAKPLPPHESSRVYLLEMIEQLAIMARRTGDIETAILLKAILEVARVTDRKRSI